jgi:hypothetical protein
VLVNPWERGGRPASHGAQVCPVPPRASPSTWQIVMKPAIVDSRWGAFEQVSCSFRFPQPSVQSNTQHRAPGSSISLPDARLFRCAPMHHSSHALQQAQAILNTATNSAASCSQTFFITKHATQPQGRRMKCTEGGKPEGRQGGPISAPIQNLSKTSPEQLIVSGDLPHTRTAQQAFAWATPDRPRSSPHRHQRPDLRWRAHCVRLSLG